MDAEKRISELEQRIGELEEKLVNLTNIRTISNNLDAMIDKYITPRANYDNVPKSKA